MGEIIIVNMLVLGVVACIAYVFGKEIKRLDEMVKNQTMFTIQKLIDERMQSEKDLMDIKAYIQQIRALKNKEGI